jgi:hypothetical protein
MKKAVSKTALVFVLTLTFVHLYQTLGQQQPPTGLARLQANIERITRIRFAKLR